MTIGRSRRAADPVDLYRAGSEARLAVNVGEAEGRPLLAFEDTGAYRLLLPAMSEDPGELERFYAETIEPLSAYDDQYETELVATVEAYLDNDGNVAATAKQLFTHRHTVRYRLERVRELCGHDVSATEGREKLGLGLKAMRVLGIPSPRGPALEPGAEGGQGPPLRRGLRDGPIEFAAALGSRLTGKPLAFGASNPGSIPGSPFRVRRGDRFAAMEMGGAQMDPEVREGLRRSWRALMAVGVLAIFIGCVAILVPAVASVGTAIFIGWVLVAAGAFLVAAAFSAHSIGTVVLRLVWAALTVVVGVWLVVEPHNGTLTLTLVLGIYFLFMGVTRIAVAFAGRGQDGAGLVGLSGIAGLLIGILVLAKFPSSADWAIGLLVGIDLIFAGWTLTSVALVGKDLAKS